MRRVVRALVAASIISGVGVAGATSSVSAATSCPARSTTTAFAAWGDANSYFVAPQGRFEGATDAWSQTGGARVIADQAPWRVNGSSDARAMLLPAGASVRSVAFCVGANEETLRLFYRSPGNGSLSIRMQVAAAQGTAVSTYGFSTSSAGWGISPIIRLPSLRDANGDQWVTLMFSSSGGSWLVDDVMIDPWISR